MKLYLSSYKTGDRTDELIRMAGSGARIGYVPNALDFSSADPNRRRAHVKNDMDEMNSLGFRTHELDLKKHFGDSTSLRHELEELDGLWVSGGNVFVLRQAMALCGLDDCLKEHRTSDLFYGGYSAAGCVLSPTLKCYAIVDDANETPYDGIDETMWGGLGLIDFAFLPHFDSDHPESDAINKEVDYCENHSIAYRTLKDGEAIVMEC